MSKIFPILGEPRILAVPLPEAAGLDEIVEVVSDQGPHVRLEAHVLAEELVLLVDLLRHRAEVFAESRRAFRADAVSFSIATQFVSGSDRSLLSPSYLCMVGFWCQ